MNVPYENVRPEDVHALPPNVRRIDVREPDEYTGPLGHLANSELIPLATVEAAAQAWPRHQPLLLICRSGARSARAAVQLAALGFTRLFNLEGGMLAVRARAAAQPNS
jgi:rhodanese-related sulfurtransferase